MIMNELEFEQHTKILTEVVCEVFPIIEESLKRGKNTITIDIKKLAKEKLNRDVEKDFIDCIKGHFNNKLFYGAYVENIKRINTKLRISLFI